MEKTIANFVMETISLVCGLFVISVIFVVM